MALLRGEGERIVEADRVPHERKMRIKYEEIERVARTKDLVESCCGVVGVVTSYEANFGFGFDFKVVNRNTSELTAEVTDSEGTRHRFEIGYLRLVEDDTEEQEPITFDQQFGQGLYE